MNLYHNALFHTIGKLPKAMKSSHVSTYSQFFPSKVLATIGANLGRPLFFLFLTLLFKTPAGVVAGFQNFAWDPNSQK